MTPLGLRASDPIRSDPIRSDPIRRIEHDSRSPSLDTLTKLVHGLDLQLSTLFLGYELWELLNQRELFDLLERQDPRVRRIGIRVLRSLFTQLDAMANAPRD
jgi:transcriptional regulator with XRE-family HTH domain